MVTDISKVKVSNQVQEQMHMVLIILVYNNASWHFPYVDVFVDSFRNISLYLIYFSLIVKKAFSV